MSSAAAFGTRATPVRIALAAVAVLVAGLAAFTLYIGKETNRILSERTLSALSAEMATLRRARDQGGSDALVTAINDRMRVSSDALYRLTAADGRLLAGNLPGDILMPPSGGLFEYRRQTQPPQDVRQAAGLTVPVGDGGLLTVARDIDDQRVLAETLRRVAIIGVGGLSLAGLGFGWLLSRNLNRRVAAINTTSRAIMAGDLSQRITRDDSGDELDTLSGSLNEMLARIEELMGTLREVSDNIAHDLKTPLTRLRNRAEAALRDPAGALAFRDGLERTIEEADGLIQTFNALLLIARLEAGAIDDTKVDTDLSEAVADVVELYQPVADEAGLSIDFTTTGAVSASVNRQLFGQAVANLVDNAIKYSKGTVAGTSASTISVSVKTAENDEPVVIVGDHGPGIPEADRGRVLKRFVRLERSRSEPGTGLGLSLVAAVARLHDGTLRLEDNTPGLRVVMSLRGKGRHAH